MWETILDPETLKFGCGLAAAVYGVATAILVIAAASSTSPLRRDARLVAPILAVVALSLALVDVEFPRASQTLLAILYPCVIVALGAGGVGLMILSFRALRNRALRVVALVAAPLPIAVSGVLVLVAELLAHSRFCC